MVPGGQYPEGTTPTEAKQIDGFVWAFGQFQDDIKQATLVPETGAGTLTT
jgi:hypothetical protein